MTDSNKNLKTENNENKRLAGMLGFAMRAGKLTVGTDLVCKMIAKGNAKLIVISEGASAGTKKKLMTKSEFYKIPFIEVKVDTERLAEILGKEHLVAAVAVNDERFAEEIKKAAY